MEAKRKEDELSKDSSPVRVRKKRKSLKRASSPPTASPLDYYGHSPVRASLPSYFDDQHNSSNFEEGFYNSWGLELKDDEFVSVRVKASPSNIIGEDEVVMPKAEAICMSCFKIFVAEDVQKTKCKCKFALIHKDCAIEWAATKGNNCHICEQQIQYVPVTLSQTSSSFTLPNFDEQSCSAIRFWRMLSRKFLRKKK